MDMDELTENEYAFVLNASEIDILPGVWGDLVEEDKEKPVSFLVPILLRLVDQGWVRVHRVIPWTSPSGIPGYQPGPVVDRADLPAVLADPEEWEYPGEFDWIGKLTLTRADV